MITHFTRRNINDSHDKDFENESFGSKFCVADSDCVLKSKNPNDSTS